MEWILYLTNNHYQNTAEKLGTNYKLHVGPISVYFGQRPQRHRPNRIRCKCTMDPTQTELIFVPFANIWTKKCPQGHNRVYSLQYRHLIFERKIVQQDFVTNISKVCKIKPFVINMNILTPTALKTIYVNYNCSLKQFTSG